MDYYSHEISRLIEEFSRLPGIGAKSAQRLAFHVINMPQEQAEALEQMHIRKYLQEYGEQPSSWPARKP